MRLRATGLGFILSAEVLSAPLSASPVLGTEDTVVNKAAEMFVGP